MNDTPTKILYLYPEEMPAQQAIFDQLDVSVSLSSMTTVSFLSQNADALTHKIDRLIISGDIDQIKAVLEVVVTLPITIAILPLPYQRGLRKSLCFPDSISEQLDLVLTANASTRDIIRCNEHIVFYKATIGRLPVIDSADDLSGWKKVKRLIQKISGIKLLDFSITPDNRSKIRSAACGCMVIHHYTGSIASKLIANDANSNDGMVSLVLSSPTSVIDYLKFVIASYKTKISSKRLPNTISYIKSKSIEIDTKEPLKVTIDGGHSISTPVKFTVDEQKLNIVMGGNEHSPNTNNLSKERIDVKNLPINSEIAVATSNKLPFFSYASEERFKDLFVLLRDDASLNSIYIVLMVLSTVLATLGLYLSSASVVIGAMLLAPLMAPIVSIAMGILRGDKFLSRHSFRKIMVGIAIALGSSGLISLLFPNQLITLEMLARTNPSLLDLGVAIFAGIAGAYTKAHKELMQSLAGVAIAVALVPPLAVAGIGLGRGEWVFFGQAFLLFSTNLVGIIIAATLTFRTLGYSATIKSKRSILSVLVLLCFISIPLYFTYENIVSKVKIEQNWTTQRFLVNGKYLIIRDADLFWRESRDVLDIEVLAREQLTRHDLDIFKQKIQKNLSRKLVIRANITYIL